jgi:hypothetical protein
MESEEHGSQFFIPFILLLAAYCIWVLTSPIFPSLDGSLHLYYASVLGSLISGSKSFSGYYFIRHVLPPYALHYYFLIAAGHLFGYVIADKLLVCLIFITTAFGFRYLAQQFGPSGGILSLLVIPLVLTWPLGMGFYNYCLAIGMALWALGMWYRAVRVRSHWMWIGFLIFVFLMVLTHPVPTAFVYILVGIDVAWRFVREFHAKRIRENRTSTLWRFFRWDLFYMLAAWSTFLYIAHFIGTHRVLGNLTQPYPRKVELLRLAKLSTLAMFSGSQPLVIVYRISLYIVLILSIALAARGLAMRWRSGKIETSDVFFICSLVLFIIIPILPPVMNGANYFAQRLMSLVWIGMLAAASGYAGSSRRLKRWAALCFFVYGIGVLVFANSRIAPVAASISKIETEPIVERSMSGLILGLPDAPDPSDLNYVPYYWAGARYFRRTESTLLNGGWLYQYYLPLGSKLDSITDEFPQQIQDSPGNAFQLLMRSKKARQQMMPHANLVLFTGQSDSQQLQNVLHVLDGAEPSRQWECSVQTWYSVCTAPSRIEAKH